MYNNNQRPRENTFKEIKGYVSKRARLQLDNNNLEKIQTENGNTTSETSHESQLSITKLLSLPNRIRSALENDHAHINVERSSTIPRRKIISFPKEHTKGVNSLSWCGSFGQVLASASMDCTVRIWDVFRTKKCVRIIKHDGAVKDIRWNINFNNILSGGYDKTAKISDIETGITIQESRKFFGSVNDIEFFPSGDNVLTCSDYVVRNASDKNIMVWEIDSMTAISNQIYQEAFSCTALRFHPFRKHFVAQSNGNYVAIFGGEKPWKLDKRKRFEGHLVNGHPIRCNFSAEPEQGRFLASGDANGGIFFYEWSSSKVVKVIEGAHQGACIDVCWHPLLNGIIASCGWDGKVALWGTNTFTL
ncbi:250_t:CDS:2 [Cetraspora pellucida]|uniref:250_t:CDS:1 n=1 Tax=Cetraspora pellucida TaxID=1433469 RepID=A0A9N8WA50_9GLOM|nr:250_t:CDS:2 [Cetraspora pellucida]